MLQILRPNPSLQLTPKAFASRRAGRFDHPLEFMKKIVDVAQAGDPLSNAVLEY
jgi:hypothetical protein